MAAKVENLCFDDSISHLKSLSTELQQQKMFGNFCDVSLKIFGHSVAVHSCVLAAFCHSSDPVCGSNKFPNLKQKTLETLEVDVGEDAMDPTKHAMYRDALNKIVDFVYTGKLDINVNTAVVVKRVAEKIQLKRIVDYCDNLLCACDCESTRSPKRKKHLRVKKKYGKKSRNGNIENANDSLQPSQVHINICINEVSEHENSKIGEKVLNNCVVDLPVSCVDSGREDTISNTQTVADNDLKTNCKPNNDEPEPSTVLQKPFACDRCPFIGRTALQLRKHERTHAGGKWYACYSCGFLALKVNRLLNHLHEMRHNETICSLCSFEAGSSIELQEHLRQHEHSKPFFCWSCDRRFSTRTALNLHLPKHSNQKPFVCLLCSRGFKWKHALQNHMLVHSQEKQHLCDQCGYRTAHQSSFKAHCLLHSGATFKCSQIGCAFEAVRKQNLQQHLRTHLKEKPFQCEVCGRAFSLVKNLRRHARMHNATESLLSCPDCGFTSTRIDKVKEHTRKHHTSPSNWEPSGISGLPVASPHSDDEDDEVLVENAPENCSGATLSTFFPNLHMVLDGGTLAPVSETLSLTAGSLSMQNASSLPITVHSIQDVGGQQIVTYSTLPVTQALPLMSFHGTLDPGNKEV